MDFHLWCDCYSPSVRHWDYLSLLQVTLQDSLFAPQSFSSHGCFPVGTYRWNNVEYWVEGVDFQGWCVCDTCHFAPPGVCRHVCLAVLLPTLSTVLTFDKHVALLCIFKGLMRLNFFQLLSIFKHLSCLFISPFFFLLA